MPSHKTGKSRVRILVGPLPQDRVKRFVTPFQAKGVDFFATHIRMARAKTTSVVKTLCYPLLSGMAKSVFTPPPPPLCWSKTLLAITPPPPSTHTQSQKIVAGSLFGSFGQLLLITCSIVTLLFFMFIMMHHVM